jgi:L-lactate dehydrogenase complex protein LldF
VGQLFAEKLGIPYTEDIPTLTNTARKVLREVFLTADVGLSGVNFGVVESGMLVIVTNEGNGRMVTTLPPVHIALMGMERFVPTMDDLALFLSLLPRSATGQKLSVYTSLIHSSLPGQTRHLILLDNGRSALRTSHLAQSLYCIRCGACLNACPVFREIGGHAYESIYPGPIGSVISSALIDLPGLLLRFRSGLSPKSPKNGDESTQRSTKEGVGIPFAVKFGLKAFRLAAGIPSLFAVFQSLGGLLSRVYSPRRAYMRTPTWTGWGYSKDFPRLAVSPFRARWKKLNREGATSKERGQANVKKEQQCEELGALRVSQPHVLEVAGLKSLADQFIEELTALGGAVVRVSGNELPGRLAEFLNSKGIDRVYVDDVGAKYVTNIPLVHVLDPAVRCGVTGTLCGIADTGSVVLVSGAGQTLTASLLPEIHVALLKTSAIRASLPQVLNLWEVREAAAGVIVTGPSRTGDIEMTHTIGVHGPGEIHVFLIDDL